MSKLRFHVKKGDEVKVISGNHQGASGKVLQVLPKKQQVLIEGVRLIKKTQRQGACCTSQPPSTGPIAVVMAEKPDQVPIACPRAPVSASRAWPMMR